MPENALHLRQMNAGLQQVGSAAVPKLMQAVQRHLGPPGDGMNPDADRGATEALAGAAHQQRTLAAGSRFLQLVMAKGQVGSETPQRHLRQRHTALTPRL